MYHQTVRVKVNGIDDAYIQIFPFWSALFAVKTQNLVCYDVAITISVINNVVSLTIAKVWLPSHICSSYIHIQNNELRG